MMVKVLSMTIVMLCLRNSLSFYSPFKVGHDSWGFTGPVMYLRARPRMSSSRPMKVLRHASFQGLQFIIKLCFCLSF